MRLGGSWGSCLRLCLGFARPARPCSTLCSTCSTVLDPVLDPVLDLLDRARPCARPCARPARPCSTLCSTPLPGLPLLGPGFSVWVLGCVCGHHEHYSVLCGHHEHRAILLFSFRSHVLFLGGSSLAGEVCRQLNMMRGMSEFQLSFDLDDGMSSEAPDGPTQATLLAAEDDHDPPPPPPKSGSGSQGGLRAGTKPAARTLRIFACARPASKRNPKQTLLSIRQLIWSAKSTWTVSRSSREPKVRKPWHGISRLGMILLNAAK